MTVFCQARTSMPTKADHASRGQPSMADGKIALPAARSSGKGRLFHFTWCRSSLPPLPALHQGLPPALPFQQHDRLFDFLGAALPEQILLPSSFVFGHQPFIAITGAATHQSRTLGQGQPLPNPPQVGEAMPAGMLLAGTHFHVQSHAQGPQENRVIGMAGPAWLVGIMTRLCAFLMAVNRFDGHIQIGNPRLFQRGSIAAFSNASVCQRASAAPSWRAKARRRLSSLTTFSMSKPCGLTRSPRRAVTCKNDPPPHFSTAVYIVVMARNYRASGFVFQGFCPCRIENSWRNA